jgi:hypothetical protein
MFTIHSYFLSPKPLFLRSLWSGFSSDESICIEYYESQTHIRTKDLLVKQLGQDMLNIKHTPGDIIADDQVVEIQIDNKRKIEQFELHKTSVVEITFQDPSVSKEVANKVNTCTAFDGEVDEGAPALYVYLLLKSKPPHIRSLSTHNRCYSGQKNL